MTRPCKKLLRFLSAATNVLAALPKSAHPGAKGALAETYTTEHQDHALAAAKTFAADYRAKWPQGRRQDH